MPTTTVEAPAPAVHFFVSSALGWATATRLEDALRKLARDTGATVLRRCLNSGGLHVWACRVLLPHDAHYTINHYAPEIITGDADNKGQPVPVDSPQCFVIVNVHGTAVPIARDAEVLNTRRG